jgi:hypothetical protein
MEAERVSGIAILDIRFKHVRSRSFEETKSKNIPHSQVSHPWTTNFPKENGFNPFPNTVIIWCYSLIPGLTAQGTLFASLAVS